MLKFFREINNQRHPGAGIIKESFASGKYPSVVGEIKDDGIFAQFFIFQFFQGIANLLIHFRDQVIKLGVIVPEDGGIWMIWGKMNFFRVVLGRETFMEFSLVSDAEVKHNKERLAGFELVKIWLCSAFIPGKLGEFLKVVIGFEVVIAVITFLAEILGKAVNKAGNRLKTPHMLGS